MTEKRFDHDFVLRETLRRWMLAVSVSTQKTLARLPEFQDNEEKKKEIMRTLASLNRLDQLAKSIREENDL